MNKKNKLTVRDKARRKYKYVDRSLILFLLTSFQVITFTPVIFKDGEVNFMVAALLLGYILFEWLYVSITHGITKRINFELELIAFFLSGIGLCVTASVEGFDAMLKQLITVLCGVIVYTTLLWFLKDVKRVMAVRTPLAVFSLLFLAGSFVFIRQFVGAINGAYNWIVIKG
ncbi:MAG: hypothetical protein IKB12_05985, partial [Clostridia bacterium]|nr:hypothetical protein [Clostridia bacterium]